MGESAAGNDARLGAEFGDDAIQDAVDQSDVAVVKAALQMADGVGADDLGGPFDVDAAQAGGAGKQRIGTQAEAGGDDAAEILPAGGNDLKFRRRAEVDDDRRAPVFLEGGDGVAQPVCPQLSGVVDQNRHAGLDAWLDEQRIDVEVDFADLAQG